MINQRIMTIDAKALFKYFPKKKGSENEPFLFDTRKKSLFTLVVNNVNEMEECPLFHQIMTVLDQDRKYKPFLKEENSRLYDQLIIMDFDDIFMPLDKNASE